MRVKQKPEVRPAQNASGHRNEAEGTADAEVTVIGVLDEKWGETVKAAIESTPGTTVDCDDLVDLCPSRLAGFTRPTSPALDDALPRNASGKALKTEPHAPYWTSHDRRTA